MIIYEIIKDILLTLKELLKKYKLLFMINETKEGLLKLNSVNQGDCLELMQNIADKSVDMILADLP